MTRSPSGTGHRWCHRRSSRPLSQRAPRQGRARRVDMPPLAHRVCISPP